MRESSFLRLLTTLMCLAVLCCCPVMANTASPDKVPATAAEPAVEATKETEQVATESTVKTAERRSFTAPPSERPGSGMALSKIVISLALVVTLVFVLGWLFKKLTLRLPGSRQIKVICSLPLGAKERLLVIEMQGKQRVIGVTAHSINMLFELENPLPEEKLASDFHTQLQSLLKK